MRHLRRILVIHDYPGRGGGAEILVHEVVDGLRERGLEVRLLTSDAGEVGARGVDRTFRGALGPSRAFREMVNPSAVRALGKELAEFRPDMVHLGMFLTQASPAILPALRTLPTLWWANEYKAICPKGTRMLPDRSACTERPGLACVRHGCMSPHGIVPRWLQLRLLARWRGAIDRTLTPSRAMADELGRLGWPVHGVLPHGTGESRVQRELAPRPLVAFAGRLEPTKGVDVLLRAFALAEPDRVDARLAVLGDGPLGPELERLARELGIAHRVEFTGHVPHEEVEKRLASAWVQCVPSLWAEPYGLVTVEAQRRGTVVVASGVGAQPELIRDGETGILVPPGDSVALAASLQKIWSGDVDLVALGDRGRTSADRHHDFESSLSTLIGHYHALIQSVDS